MQLLFKFLASRAIREAVDDYPRKTGLIACLNTKVKCFSLGCIFFFGVKLELSQDICWQRWLKCGIISCL